MFWQSSWVPSGLPGKILFSFFRAEGTVRLKDINTDTKQNILTKIYINKRLEGFTLDRIYDFNLSEWNDNFNIIVIYSVIPFIFKRQKNQAVKRGKEAINSPIHSIFSIPTGTILTFNLSISRKRVVKGGWRQEVPCCQVIYNHNKIVLNFRFLFFLLK